MSRLKMSVRLSGGPPWGFRLEGKTVDHPNLKVSKVRAKSKSYNILKEGDFVICINGIATKDLTYDQAMDMIDGSATDLTLDLLRVRPVSSDWVDGGGSESHIVLPPPPPPPKMEDAASSATIQHETSSRTQSQMDNITSEKQQSARETQVSKKESVERAVEGSKGSDGKKLDANDVRDSDEEISDEDLTSSNEESTEEEEEIEEEEDEESDEEIVKNEVTHVDPQKGGRSLTDSKEISKQHPDINRAPEHHSGTEDAREGRCGINEAPEHPSEKDDVSDHHSGIVEPSEQVINKDSERGLDEVVGGRHSGLKQAGSNMNSQSNEGVLLSFPSATAVETSTDCCSANQTVGGWGLGVPAPFGAPPKIEREKEVVVVVDVSGLVDSSTASLDGGHNSFCNGFHEHQGQLTTMDSSSVGQHNPMFKVSKIVGRSQTWTPSTGYVRPSEVISKYQNNFWKRTRCTGGLGRGPRPKSMPVAPVDIRIDEANEDNRNGRSHSEEKDFSQYLNGHTIPTDSNRLMKIIQPPEPIEDMDVLISRKKMFSSSSFYEEPRHIYPTVEEQVDLCKKIADSLSSDTNQLSKGASMYNKRKKRADKWAFEGPEPLETDQGGVDYSSSPDIGNYSQSQSSYHSESTHRKLKLVLDPRQLQDSTRLRHLGLYNEHNLISPDICFDLVKDLNSPTGKGAALFAKRKKKSEKWVVDEATVKQHEQQHVEDTSKYILNSHYTQPQTPLSHLEAYEKMISHRRLKLVKSPWEAALESPIGSCDAAFQEVRYQEKLPQYSANQLHVVKRAEEQLSTVSPTPTMSSTSPYVPLEPPPVSLSVSPISNEASHLRSTSFSPNYGRFSASGADVYKPRAPKGWGGHTTEYSSLNLAQEAPAYLDITSTEISTYSPSGSNFDINQCADFNTRARQWKPGQLSGGQSFKSVRPPSLIF